MLRLRDVLDLVREASNAAQLRRNMAGLDLVLIPEMFWDFCHPEVMVMERMKGVPISQLDRLREAGVGSLRPEAADQCSGSQHQKRELEGEELDDHKQDCQSEPEDPQILREIGQHPSLLPLGPTLSTQGPARTGW